MAIQGSMRCLGRTPTATRTLNRQTGMIERECKALRRMAATNKCFCCPEKSPAPNAGCPPSCSDLPIGGRFWVNPSHHGSDEQMFGAAQQVLHRGLVD